MNGVIDAQTEDKGGHRGFKCRKDGSREVENAVGPNQRTGKANQREDHLIHRTEGNAKHDDHDQEGQANQNQKVVKRALVDVVR